MTNVELEAHIEAMPAIRAERLLDAVQVATYPLHLQHAPMAARAWWRQLMAETQDTIAEAVRSTHRAPRFVFNGVAVGVSNLKRKLAESLGGGFAA